MKTIVGEIVEVGDNEKHGGPVILLRVDEESARNAGGLLYRRAALSLRMAEACDGEKGGGDA